MSEFDEITPEHDSGSEEEKEPTYIDGVMALQPNEEDMKKFDKWGFDLSMGNQDIQEDYFKWCNSKGFFTDISAKDIIENIPTRGEESLNYPNAHPKVEDRERDIIEKNMRWRNQVGDPKPQHDTEELENKLFGAVVKRDWDIIDDHKSRSGRKPAKNVSEYDTRTDKYGSNIRRMMIKKPINPNGEYGNHRIHDVFIQKIREKISEIRPILKDVNEWDDSDIDTYNRLSKIYSQDTIESFKHLISKWEEHHPGKDYFDEA